MYHKVKIVNVPCNLVQTEISNRSTGYYSVDDLLSIWNQCKRINTDEFFNLSAKEAINKKYSFYSLSWLSIFYSIKTSVVNTFKNIKIYYINYYTKGDLKFKNVQPYD